MPDTNAFTNSDGSKRLRLLIVDDDPADRALIKAMVELAQFDVLEAATGEEGIKLAKEFKLDCAIVDQRLPDMVGTEVFDALRSGTCDAHLPIILFTGQGSELLAVEAMHGGAADYLPKRTLSPVSLGSALTNALQQAQLRRELSAERLRIIAVNQELIRANDELCSFYETVSHQLKTPLTAIRELTSITLEGKGGPLTEEQEEYLSASLTSCDRLSHMIDGLVDTTRVETGQLSYDLKHCQVNPIIQDSVEVLRPVADKAGIALELDLGNDLPAVMADSIRLGQLVNNLVANAIKFTDEGTIVIKSQALEGNTISVSVSDTGRGISPKFIDNIFERFAQTRVEDSEFHQGMGIGLYVCADIARHHSGELQVKSELNEGSTFTLTLPIAGEKAEAKNAHSAA
ncbi:MAG: ATP-binding protein [Halioglobus sp.]